MAKSLLSINPTEHTTIVDTTSADDLPDDLLVKLFHHFHVSVRPAVEYEGPFAIRDEAGEIELHLEFEADERDTICAGPVLDIARRPHASEVPGTPTWLGNETDTDVRRSPRQQPPRR